MLAKQAGGARHKAHRLVVLTPLAVLSCVPVLPPRPALLPTLPLYIEGQAVGDAILDTGGGYELILKDSFGLEPFEEVDVLAFGGLETVELTRGFRYQVGGIEQTANVALIGVSTCNCNGVGFHFFRKAQAVLAISFDDGAIQFVGAAPEDGIHLPFAAPPPSLPNFDSAFLVVDVESAGREQKLLALLDTGTNGTFLRRGLFASRSGPFLRDRLDARVTRPELGTVAVNVGLYDTAGLPDMIVGTDVMRAWGSRWYFTYHARGGSVTVFPTVVAGAPTRSSFD